MTVGFLRPCSRPLVSFEQRMRELGYIQGQNFAFELIDTGDQVARMSEAVQELVRRKVDVLVESSGVEQGLKAALLSPGGGHEEAAISKPAGCTCRRKCRSAGLIFRRR